MTDKERQAAIYSLMSARASIDSTLSLLTEQEKVCKHENRTDMGGFGGKEHWICRDCGLEVEDGVAKEKVPGQGGP